MNEPQAENSLKEIIISACNKIYNRCHPLPKDSAKFNRQNGYLLSQIESLLWNISLTDLEKIDDQDKDLLRSISAEIGSDDYDNDTEKLEKCYKGLRRILYSFAPTSGESYKHIQDLQKSLKIKENKIEELKRKLDTYEEEMKRNDQESENKLYEQYTVIAKNFTLRAKSLNRQRWGYIVASIIISLFVSCGYMSDHHKILKKNLDSHYVAGQQRTTISDSLRNQTEPLFICSNNCSAEPVAGAMCSYSSLSLLTAYFPFILIIIWSLYQVVRFTKSIENYQNKSQVILTILPTLKYLSRNESEPTDRQFTFQILQELLAELYKESISRANKKESNSL